MTSVERIDKYVGRRTAENFEEIKGKMQNASILHLPEHKGTCHLYSDTSKFATGSASYQIQNGKIRALWLSN